MYFLPFLIMHGPFSHSYILAFLRVIMAQLIHGFEFFGGSEILPAAIVIRFHFFEGQLGRLSQGGI